LDLSHNEIIDLPPEFSKLVTLTDLDLSGNMIITLPKGNESNWYWVINIVILASSHQIFQKCQNFLIYFVGIIYFLKNLMGTCNNNMLQWI
jgi:hypothetical protein